MEQNEDVLLSFLNGGKGTHNSPILQEFPDKLVKFNKKRKNYGEYNRKMLSNRTFK